MLDNAVPLFPGLPGGPEVLIVLFVLVLLFGANKIPKLARSTGEAMGEFKKGRQEVEEELKEMDGTGSEATPGDAPTAVDSTAAGSETTAAADSTATDSETTAAADSTATDSETTAAADSTAADASEPETDRDAN